MEHQQVLLLHIWKLWQRADLCIHNGIVDCDDSQKYSLSQVTHQLPINWYCKLQTMQKCHIGC
jgi:hypothetical protein